MKKKKKVKAPKILWAMAHDHRPDLGDGPEPSSYVTFATRKAAVRDSKKWPEDDLPRTPILGPYVLIDELLASLLREDALTRKLRKAITRAKRQEKKA